MDAALKDLTEASMSKRQNNQQSLEVTRLMTENELLTKSLDTQKENILSLESQVT